MKGERQAEVLKALVELFRNGNCKVVTSGDIARRLRSIPQHQIQVVLRSQRMKPLVHEEENENNRFFYSPTSKGLSEYDELYSFEGHTSSMLPPSFEETNTPIDPMQAATTPTSSFSERLRRFLLGEIRVVPDHEQELILQALRALDGNKVQ